MVLKSFLRNIRHFWNGSFISNYMLLSQAILELACNDIFISFIFSPNSDEDDNPLGNASNFGLQGPPRSPSSHWPQKSGGPQPGTALAHGSGSAAISSDVLLGAGDGDSPLGTSSRWTEGHARVFRRWVSAKVRVGKTYIC